MGVHGLWELLAPVGRRVSVETLGSKKLAIDASIWIVQFLKAMRDERGDVLRNAHLLGFFRRICKLLFLRVKPVFVFDGGTPFLKRRTVIARRRQRDQAQSKIRKTAEKLLLNQLKARKVEELLREEEEKNSRHQGSQETSDSATAKPESRTSTKSQEDADALLAASLAKEWEGENEAPINLQSEGEEDVQILPVAEGKVDPAVLASLPPSMQLRLLDEMREHLVAENRQKFQNVAKAPSSFSQLQINAYLKTVAFRREIVEVQKAAGNPGIDGVASTRVASEVNREFIFTNSNKDENPRGSNSVLFKRPEVQSSQPAAPQSKPSDVEAVQTYYDDQGRKRVSRIRGMGVRMTRDLQWNLYLMKDKENRKLSVETMDEDDPTYRNIVLDTETKSKDGAVESEIEWDEGVVLQQKDVASSEQDEEIEWEDQTQSGTRTIQVSLDYDGCEDPDDEIFKKLISSSQVAPQASTISTTGNQEPISHEGVRSCNTQVSDGSKDPNDETFIDLVNSSKDDDDDEIEWEEDVALAVAADDDEVDASAQAKPDAQQELESNAGKWNDTSSSQETNRNTEKSNGGEMDHQARPKVDQVLAAASTFCGEEQAQIEEAIRRSITDFGPRNVYGPLRIRETKSATSDDNCNRVADTPSDALQQERARKGKAAVEDNVPADRPVQASTEDAADKDQDDEIAQRQSVFVTEEEERFLQGEESSLRRAALDQERERLLEEELDLRAEKKKSERNAESVTSEMFSECQELLQLFGLPYVVAPMEAEAQCAFMDIAELVDGVITDDSDVFLFGARSVYKNLFDGHKYVETYYMKDVQSDLGLTQEKLIRMAMLLGSDYTEGISGIGIVNAIEVVNAFPEDDGLVKLKEWIDSPDLNILDKLRPRTGCTQKQATEPLEEVEPEVDRRKRKFMEKHRAVSKNWSVPLSFPSKAVVEAYSSPQVDKSTETFVWGRPDLDLLRKFCNEKFGWPKDKADELLVPVLKEYDRRESQSRLDQFYSFNQRFAKIRSRRIQQAVTGITGRRLTEIMDASADIAPPKKQRRRKAPTDGTTLSNKRSKKSAANQPNAARATRKSSRAKKQVNCAVDAPAEAELAAIDLEISAACAGEAAGGGFVPEEDSNTQPGSLFPEEELGLGIGEHGDGGFVPEEDSNPEAAHAGLGQDSITALGSSIQHGDNRFESNSFVVERDDHAIGLAENEGNADAGSETTSLVVEKDDHAPENGATRLLAIPFFRRKKRRCSL